MKLWLSPYELKAKTGELRKGYLVKTQAPEQAPGYSDLFPWPEFGDPEFSEIPSCIQKGQSTPLIKRSLYFSRRDALERTEKHSLIQGRVVKNHFLVFGEPTGWKAQIEQAFAEGFESVKIKVGRDMSAEVQALNSLVEFKRERPWLRLDCNSRGSQEFLQNLNSIKPLVQFVEDPFSEVALWRKMDWPWAFDQSELDPSQVDYFFRVIKPAKQEWELDEDHPLIFTSYLDHPVGIAHAMVEALDSGRQLYDYGLMSHNHYEATPFHEYITTKGPHMTVAGEFGIGFDELFDDLDWVQL